MVLFLCTGNYYRSRLAEDIFNHYAEVFHLQTRSSSRGLGYIWPNPNTPGMISNHVLDYLAKEGIDSRSQERMPLECKQFGLELIFHWGDRSGGLQDTRLERAYTERHPQPVPFGFGAASFGFSSLLSSPEGSSSAPPSSSSGSSSDSPRSHGTWRLGNYSPEAGSTAPAPLLGHAAASRQAHATRAATTPLGRPRQAERGWGQSITSQPGKLRANSTGLIVGLSLHTN
jgi:hypothetical protein